MTVDRGRAPASVRRLRIDTTSLFLSSGVNAVLGLVFWIVATRLYPVEEVGRATTLVNSAVLLGSLSNIGLGAAFERFLPVAGRRTRRYIGGGQGAIVLTSASMGTAFALLGPVHLLFTSALQGVIFVISVVVLAQFTLMDSILVGLQAGRVSATKNTFHALAKLGAIVALAGVGSGFGVLLGWVLPALIAVGVVELVIWRGRLLGVTARTEESTLPRWGLVAGYYGSSFGWMVGQVVPGLVIPILVADRLGLADAAYFNIAWTIVNASLLLMTLVTGPFVSASSRPGADIASLTVDLIRMLVVASVVRAGILAVAGPIALYTYGTEYGDNGTSVLWIMAICHAIAGPGYLFGALARVYRQVRYPMFVQIVSAVGVVLLAQHWIGYFGINGVAWAFLVQDLAILAAATPPLIGLLRRALAGQR